MLFNSYLFIFAFLPIALIGMFTLARCSHRLATLWLVMMSLVFYASWDFRFVGLLLGSITFNYGAAYLINLRLGSQARRQAGAILSLTIISNLSVLGYFKYTNFFLGTLNEALGTHWGTFNIILPLGISFFTFTQIAFLVDVYRGIAKEPDFAQYLLFVTYFPHLIAGPVLHHKQMMPQFSDPITYRINPAHLSLGVSIFVVGLMKKVLVADYLSGIASPIFDAVRDGSTLRFFEAWIGALAYSLQLYFDFSGYSDMAIGLSLLFNIRLPLNFNSPYKARNIIEFWKRWHMTLSAFLKDYLYIPLGGNRRGSGRRYINLLATMVLGGLWHGASWTFIAWGTLHGVYLVINRLWGELTARLGYDRRGRPWSLFSIALTFLSVVLAWVFFRADSLQSAWSFVGSMLGLHGLSLPAQFDTNRVAFAQVTPWLTITNDGLLPISRLDTSSALLAVAGGLILVWGFPNVRQLMAGHRPSWNDMVEEQEHPAWLRWSPSRSWALTLGACLFVVLLAIGASKASEFLYFQF